MSDRIPSSILVLEDESCICELIINALRKSGIKNVQGFMDGDSAWQAIQQDEFDFFVLDWKVPKVNGLTMINRIRSMDKYRFVPVLVISGLVTGKDFRLLEEMPLTALVEKPFNDRFFIKKTQALFDEFLWLRNEEATIAKLLRELNSEKPSALFGVKALIAVSPRPNPLRLAAVRILIEHNQLSDAEKILDEALKQDPNCVAILHELGKIYLKSQRFTDANKILRMAESESPDNLERLCLLGSTSMNLLEPELAQQYFKKAMILDSEDQTAKDGATLATNMETYLSRFDVTSIPKSFAGLMNAIGISLVRTQQFEQGLNHYRSAMSYVESDDVKGKLAFNVGSGYLRWQKPDDALRWFQNAWELSKNTNTRASQYIRLLKGSSNLQLDPGPTENKWEQIE